jgi:methylmalonyl-CoA/ethylmalonyl-CoA epimerase
VQDAIELVPGFLFVDHIAICVPVGELESQVAIYKALGFHEIHREDVQGTDQVREVMLQLREVPNLMQLIEPLSAESPVARQLQKSGGRPALAHIAFRVADIRRAFAYLKQNGFRIIDEAPRQGSRGTAVFFVHPKTTDAIALGYLLEVVAEGDHG